MVKAGSKKITKSRKNQFALVTCGEDTSKETNVQET